jgi:predicted MFS family arabinose efflux permease
LIVMWLLLAVLNIGSGISGPLLMTFFHRHTPEKLLGRALGTFSSAAMVSSPIGVLAGGALIETQGFGFTALMGAIAMALVLGLLTLNSALTDLSGPAPAATPS